MFRPISLSSLTKVSHEVNNRERQTSDEKEEREGKGASPDRPNLWWFWGPLEEESSRNLDALGHALDVRKAGRPCGSGCGSCQLARELGFGMETV